MKFYTTDSKISKASPDLLGGKGYGLWEMSKAGLPVPPAVIIPPAVCRAYAKDPEKVMAWIDEKVLPKTEAFMYKKLEGHPPLLSVRSGGKVSMPGMMDTVLNVGMDEENFFHYRERLGIECHENCRHRLVEMYSDVVMGIERAAFEDCKDADAAHKRYWALTKEPFPDGRTQLLRSIEAVFKSWDNPRAVAYRELNGISHKEGTAVILQAMVYGNSGEHSMTGVVFTRDPNTGVNELFGEYLVNAQGEDIVAGIRTPKPIAEMAADHPAIYATLSDILDGLEADRKDMQDVEFTVDAGTLWILQTRSGKRTSEAAIRIALDMHFAEEIDFATLCGRVKLEDYLNVTRPKLAPGAPEPTGTGIAASNGIAIGRAVFSSEAATKCSDPCILIAKETTPEDITGMAAAAGILTVTGGATSHAAVVARGMNTPAVVGATNLEIKGELSAGYSGVHKIDVGDWVTLDGNTGEFWLGEALPVITPAEKKGSAYILRQLILDQSDAYHIATAAADVRSYGCLIPVGLVDSIAELHTMIAIMQGGVLDLRSIASLDPASANILNMFGTKLAEEARLMSWVANASFHPNAKIKLILGEAGLPPVLEGDSRISVIPTVTSLEDLIMAEGLVFMGAYDGKVSQPVIEKVNQLKATAGEDTKAVILSASDSASFAKTEMQFLQEILA